MAFCNTQIQQKIQTICTCIYCLIQVCSKFEFIIENQILTNRFVQPFLQTSVSFTELHADWPSQPVGIV